MCLDALFTHVKEHDLSRRLDRCAAQLIQAPWNPALLSQQEPIVKPSLVANVFITVPLQLLVHVNTSSERAPVLILFLFFSLKCTLKYTFKTFDP